MGFDFKRFFTGLVHRTVHLSAIPSNKLLYFDIRLKETGGGKNMNVDGSSTPVDFFLQPASNEIFVIDYLTLLMIDPGDMDFNVFGSLATALTTGVQVFCRQNGNERIMTTLEDNSDLAQCFFGGTLSGIAPGGAADPGFLNSVDKAIGRMPFENPVFLDGSLGDRIGIKINDDLQLITAILGSAHGKTFTDIEVNLSGF